MPRPPAHRCDGNMAYSEALPLLGVIDDGKTIGRDKCTASGDASTIDAVAEECIDECGEDGEAGALTLVCRRGVVDLELRLHLSRL